MQSKNSTNTRKSPRRISSSDDCSASGDGDTCDVTSDRESKREPSQSVCLQSAASRSPKKMRNGSPNSTPKKITKKMADENPFESDVMLSARSSQKALALFSPSPVKAPKPTSHLTDSSFEITPSAPSSASKIPRHARQSPSDSFSIGSGSLAAMQLKRLKALSSSSLGGSAAKESLVAAGRNTQKLDELDFLLDGLFPSNTLSVRRMSAHRLVVFLEDDSLPLFLRSRGLISRVLEALSEFDEDETLAYLCLVCLALLCRDPMNCDFVPMDTVQTIARCLNRYHPLFCDEDSCFTWDLHKALYAMALEAFKVFSSKITPAPCYEEVHVSNLAMFVLTLICSSNVAVRKDLLNETSSLQTCVEILQMRLRKWSRLSLSAASQIGASDRDSQSSSQRENGADSGLDEWLKVTNSRSSKCSSQTSSATQRSQEDDDVDNESLKVGLWETLRTLELLEQLTATGSFEFHTKCPDLCPIVIDWLSFVKSTSTDSILVATAESADELFRQTVQGCVRVLMNSTNHNPANATRVGTMFIIQTLFSFLIPADFDMFVLSLGLLVNLSEVSASTRKRVRSLNVATGKNAIDLLVSVFKDHDIRRNAESGGEGKSEGESREREVARLEVEIVRCYLGLMIGLLISDCMDSAVRVLDAFEGSLKPILAALRDFHVLQTRFNVLPQESHISLVSLIKSLASISPDVELVFE
eukprot:ANDGO_00216.mRNA.1 hypothetical protein